MSPRTVEKIIDPLDAPFEEVVAKLVGGETPDMFIETPPPDYPRSPLRYPGGKSRAVKSLFAMIPGEEKTLCSPFLGGASLELACSTKMKVYGSDIFSPLVSFWNMLLNDRERLVAAVEKYFPLTKEKFYYLQKIYPTFTNELEVAAAFYVLNRSSFSGTTLSGGMSPGHPRFTESSIDRLRNFEVSNFEVTCADYKEVIPKHKNDFLYLDPPYMNGQALYGMNGDTHKGFDHKALAELLGERNRWIMSYNDCEEIRNLYPNNTILTVDWVYGMSKNKQSNEVLILSNDFAIAA